MTDPFLAGATPALRGLVRRWAVVALVLFAACSGGPESGGEEPGGSAPAAVSIYAVNYPLQYFAERIGGDRVRILRPAPTAGDPALWVPEAEAVVEIQTADLILLNGAGYAGWVRQVSLPEARLVDTSRVFADRLIAMPAGPTHSHGPEGEHSHDALAFTTWLDPLQAIEQAEAVAAALIALRPQQAAATQAGLEALTGDLEALDRRLLEWAEAIGDRPLVFSHPVYQYFIRRYGLNGESLHWEPDQPPTDDEWRELERLLEEHPTQWVVWEDEPLLTTASRLAEMGIESLVVAPAAAVPEEGDFIDRMMRNAAELERMLPEESP